MAEVVLITGASNPIGAATARLFAQQGAHLVITGSKASIQALALSLESDLNTDVLAIEADLGQPHQAQHLIQQALDRYTQVDSLINIAGKYWSSPFQTVDLESFQQVMAQNFWSYVHMIQAVMPHYSQQKRGQIINVGTFAGRMPLPKLATFCASQYAVTGFTDSLRLELSPQGIEVIGVYPGLMAPDPEQESLSDTTVLQDWWFSDPEEVAAAIVEASIYHKTNVMIGVTQWATGAYQVLPDWVATLLQPPNV